ncbi:hypothetical protein [Flavobacterium psychrophilum]
MKIKDQWIVFNVNQDQLLVETEKYYLYTFHAVFQEISFENANVLINEA